MLQPMGVAKNQTRLSNQRTTKYYTPQVQATYRLFQNYDENTGKIYINKAVINLKVYELQKTKEIKELYNSPYETSDFNSLFTCSKN